MQHKFATILVPLSLAAACSGRDAPESSPFLDNAPPEIVSIAVTPARAAAGVDLRVTVVADKALARLEMDLEGNPGGCLSPQSSPAYCNYRTQGTEGEGVRTLHVRAIDLQGRVGEGTAEIELDFTAPRAAIEPVPDDGSPERQIRFAASEAGTFTCSLDGATEASCGSPMMLAGLADGRHRFAVRAIDSVGNRQEPPSAVELEVDTAAPTVQIVDAPPAVSTSASATFSFEASEPSHFDCSVDGAAWVRCPNPYAVQVTSDGPHRFEVRATDRYGHLSEPAAHAWTVDTFAPAVVVLAAPPALANSRAATIAFTATKAGCTFTAALDGAAPSPAESPLTVQGLTDGSHVLSLIATDGQGRASTPAAVRWTVDTVAPRVRLVETPPARSNQAQARFAFDASEAGASFECALDSEPRAPCASPIVLTVADGLHRFAVRATDRAGNAGAETAAAFEVDLTPPDAPAIDQPDPSLTSNTTPTFSWSAVAGAEAYSFELAPAADFANVLQARAALSQTWLVPLPLASGRYFFRVKAKDDVGNESVYSRTGVLEVRTWRFLTPAPQGSTVLAAACLDAETCWFVGEAGLAMRTADGGATLLQSSTGTTANLTGLHVLDAKTAVAVGSGGTLLRTDDGGVVWNPVALPVATDLYALAFRGTTGYAVGDGGLVLKSTDAGASWTRSATGSAASLRAVQILDDAAQHVVAAGGTGAVLRSETGGAQWSAVSSGVGVLLRGLTFLDAQTGYAVGNAGTMRVTHDAGRTWSAVETGVAQDLYSVECTSASTGYTAGEATTAVSALRKVTLTAGQPPAWSEVSLPSQVVLRDLLWFEGGRAAIVAGEGGVVMRTTDGGASFKLAAAIDGAPASSNQEINAIAFPSPTAGYLFGRGGFAMKTADLGATLTPLSPALFRSRHLWAASFADERTGLVGGESSFLATTSDGETFVQRPVPAGYSINVRAVHLLDASTGAVAGTVGKLLRWDGAAFTPEPVVGMNGAALTNSLRDVKLVGTTGYLVGDLGLAARYEPASRQWRQEGSGVLSQDLLGVWAFDPETAVAVGELGRIVRRTSTGWTPVVSGTSVTLEDVAFLDAQQGWAAGDGVILATGDGGLTWTRQICPTGSTLQAIAAASPVELFAVGFSRTILTTRVGGR